MIRAVSALPRGLLAAALLILALLLPAAAERVDDAAIEDYLHRNPSAIRQIVRDYLMEEPQILREALSELLRRDEAEADVSARRAIEANADRLLRSRFSVVLGNPEGDVTLVEFFDYNCAYCRQALPHLLELLQTDPQLRVVLKEMPVLGDASVEAARVGAALMLQDAGGTMYLDFHKRLLSSPEPANRETAIAAAIAAGADLSRLERDFASAEVVAALAETVTLSAALGLTGTPSYVVGDRVIKGAAGLQALRTAIEAQRR